MDPDEQIGGLINTLLEKTRNGRLEWVSTPLSSAYNVLIPNLFHNHPPDRFGHPAELHAGHPELRGRGD